MYNQNNDRNTTSLFELVDNDFMVQYLMDQPHSFPRINSNQNFIALQQNYQVMDNQYEHIEQKHDEPVSNIKKSKSKKRKQSKDNNDSDQIQNTELFKYKNNLKNTYINKISSLMNQDQVKASSKILQQSQPKFKPFDDEKISQSFHEAEDSAQAKLQRNRECARNSRKRKKIYIELLENRVKFLNEELEKHKTILKTSASYLSKMSQNQQLQGFFLGRQQLYEKLEKALQNKADDNEINLLLDSMRFRVGGGGKERVSASNYFFNQILEICFPVHVRYMLWSASENKDLFAENSDQNVSDGSPSWLQELSGELQITDIQRKLMKKQQRRIVNDKTRLQEILTNFEKIKDELYNKTSQVENFVDDLRSTLSPTQVAKFLIGLEKNKFKREMSISKIWSLYEGISEEEEEDLDIKEEDSLEAQSHKKVHI